MQDDGQSPQPNYNVPPWLSAVVIGTTVAAAIGLLAFSAYRAPTLYSMTTDSRGNIYALFADKLYRYDATGAETLVADRAAENWPGATNEVRIGPDGSAYIADVTKVYASEYAPDGTLPALLKSGKRPPSMPLKDNYDPVAEANVSVSPDTTGTYLLARGTLFRFSANGTRTTVLDDPELELARGVNSLPDGSLVIADTAHRRILRVSQGATTTIDCGGQPDGFDFPAQLRVAPNGVLWVVLGRATTKSAKAGGPLTPLSAQRIRLGRLARVDFASGKLVGLDVRCDGPRINIQDVGFLANGKLVVSSVDKGLIYRVDPAHPADALGLADGPLGKRLNTVAAGPRYMFPWQFGWLLLGVVGLPIAVACIGVLVATVRRQARDEG